MQMIACICAHRAPIDQRKGIKARPTGVFSTFCRRRRRRRWRCRCGCCRHRRVGRGKVLASKVYTQLLVVGNTYEYRTELVRLVHV